LDQVSADGPIWRPGGKLFRLRFKFKAFDGKSATEKTDYMVDIKPAGVFNNLLMQYGLVGVSF
jgi:hypothetical protein